VAVLIGTPSNDIKRRADLATRWLERAGFASEPIEALLYLFFTLEALLGDTSEERKGEALAFRQAMLSHAVNQGFTHPNRTYFLYDEVRSAAVHGEDLPDVTWDVVGKFGSAVSKTLDDYLTYASEQGFGRRSQLVKAIREHPDQPKLIAWLRAQGGEAWGHFLAQVEAASQRGDATL
jgi:hypothetical protein